MANYLDWGADVSFVAATNLSGLQYYFVQAGSIAGEVVVSNGASNPTPLGVLMNSPSAGQEARVRVLGVAKVFAVTPSGSGINWGRYVTVNASGQAIATATESGSPIIGRWISATAPVSASRFGQIIFYGMSACNAAAS